MSTSQMQGGILPPKQPTAPSPPLHDPNNPLSRQGTVELGSGYGSGPSAPINPIPLQPNAPTFNRPPPPASVLPPPPPNQPTAPPQTTKPKIARPNLLGSIEKDIFSLPSELEGLGGHTQTQNISIVNPVGKKTTVTQISPTENELTTVTTKDPLSSENIAPSTKALGVEAAGIAMSAFIAPEVIAPKVVAEGVLIGEGVNIGVNSAAKTYSTGKPSLVLPTTPKEVLDVAGESAAFTIVGVGATSLAARFAPMAVGDVANPIVRAASRIGINTGLGAVGGAVLSGGNLMSTLEGAGFGAGFGAAGEAIGAVGGKIPTLKIGSGNVEFVDSDFEGYTGEAKMQGLFLQKGTDVTPLLTRWNNLPDEDFAQVRPTVGETPGYRPQSPIDAEATRQFLLKTGTPESVININREAVDVVNIAKGVKNPKLFDDMLPEATKTSDVDEVTKLKSYVIQNKDVVQKVFGKFGAIPQENPEFTNEIQDPTTGKMASSARVTSDIDIQLKSGITQEQAVKFAQGIKDLYSPEAGATLKPGSTLVETIPVDLRGTDSTTLAHAVDIHSDFDKSLNPNSGQEGSERTWGVKIAETPRLIEDVPTAKLSEQVAGKMQSIMDINEEGEFDPVPHRIKDIPDFLTDAKTLIDQRSNPVVKARGMAELQDIADYYGVGDIKDLPINPEQEYVMTKTYSSEPSRIPSITNFGYGNSYDFVSPKVSQISKSYISNRLIPSASLKNPSQSSRGKTPTSFLLKSPFIPRKTSFPSIGKPFASPTPYYGSPKIASTNYIPPYDINPKTSTSKKNSLLPNGSKFEGQSTNPLKSLASGLDSLKRVYPILSGEDVFKL